MLQTWGLRAQEHCPWVAMVTQAHPPSTFLAGALSLHLAHTQPIFPTPPHPREGGVWGEGSVYKQKPGEPKGKCDCALSTLLKYLEYTFSFCSLLLRLCREELPALDEQPERMLGFSLALVGYKCQYVAFLRIGLYTS